MKGHKNLECVHGSMELTFDDTLSIATIRIGKGQEDFHQYR